MGPRKKPFKALNKSILDIGMQNKECSYTMRSLDRQIKE